MLIALDTYLYLITNYDKRFGRISIILSSQFMQLSFSDNILTKVALWHEIHNKPTNVNYPSHRATQLIKQSCLFKLESKSRYSNNKI